MELIIDNREDRINRVAVAIIVIDKIKSIVDNREDRINRVAVAILGNIRRIIDK